MIQRPCRFPPAGRLGGFTFTTWLTSGAERGQTQQLCLRWVFSWLLAGFLLSFVIHGETISAARAV